jgi:hypothetical protein
LALIKSIEVDIGVKGAAAAKADIDKIDAKAEQLKKIFGDGFALKIDSAAAAEKLKVFRAQMADATKDRTANVKVKVDDSALAKLGQKMQAGGPGLLAGSALLLAPAITTIGGVAAGAGVGLAGAFVAGGAALAAFGAVAKPVLTDAAKASQAVTAAQQAHALAVEKVTGQYQIAMSTATTQAQKNAASAAEQKGLQQAALNQQLAVNKATADLSPAQAALSRQIGAMSAAWDKVKAAETPVVAGALLPWMQGITDLTGKLGPIIKQMADVVGYLGDKFRALVNSSAFTAFRDFVAGTGSAVVSAAGSTFLDFLKALMIILPQFDPLIREAAGYLAMLGPALVKWASNKATADHIQAFIKFFTTNGPVVWGLIKNVGEVLGKLVPGLTAGGLGVLKAISDFLGFVAKLPPDLVKPLAEVAGALLILNKIGVVSVGLKLIGMDAAAAAASGGTVGLWGKMLPGVRLVGGALLATVAIDMVLKNTPAGKPGSGGNWFDNPFGGSNPSNPVKGSTPNALSSWDQLGHDIEHDWDMTWRNTITRTAAGFHDLAGWFDTGRHWVATRTDLAGHDIVNWWNITWNNTVGRVARGFHDVAGWFDTGRHWVAATTHQTGVDIGNWWNITWNNTVARVARGFHDVAVWFDTGRHNIANTWDNIRHDAASAWDTIWNNTVGRVQRGIDSVMQWIGGLPGRIINALGNAGNTLYSWGSGVISGLLSGMQNIIGGVWNFIKGIPGQILKFLGINSPPQWAIDAGKHIMDGIGIGMRQSQDALKKATEAAAAAAQGGGRFLPGGSAAPSSAAPAGSLQQMAQQMLNARGWGGQWAQFNALENQEAGWNMNAVNPSSGAAGLAQFINGFGEYYQYGGNPNTGAGQLTAMMAYIAQRYGSPAAAWGHEVAFNWYGSGTNSALPGWGWVGERGPELLRFRGGEQVLPAGAGGGWGGGGSTVVFERGAIVINPPVGSNPVEIGRQVAGVLGPYLKAGGRLYPPGSVPR